MSRAAINTLVTEINETLDTVEGDYGYLKAVDNIEEATCKVTYGVTSSLDLTASVPYAELCLMLTCMIEGIIYTTKAKKTVAKEFELDYNQEQAEPAYFNCNALQLKSTTKYYEGCNLVEGEEFHVKNDAMVVVDGITGRVLRTIGNVRDLQEMLDCVNNSGYYLAKSQVFKGLPQS